MLTTLFDTVGRWCVTWPWRVLALFGLLAVGSTPARGAPVCGNGRAQYAPRRDGADPRTLQHALRDVRPRLAPRADDPGASQTT